jgi:hypothetical protein
MHTLKTILTALLLISILPWCNLAAASALPTDIDGDAYFSQEANIIQEADVAEASFITPLKNKRIAAFQQAQCGANAPFLSGTDHLILSSRNVQLVFGDRNFVPRCAQAPPTSPPRSV